MGFEPVLRDPFFLKDLDFFHFSGGGGGYKKDAPI